MAELVPVRAVAVQVPVLARALAGLAPVARGQVARGLGPRGVGTAGWVAQVPVWTVPAMWAVRPSEWWLRVQVPRWWELADG